MERLKVADGTQWRTMVYDVRQDFKWAASSGERPPIAPRALIVHHTATPGLAFGVASQMAAMQQVARTARYGLPYNFVIHPTAPCSIYYLNDVDHSWPHTYDWNDATAIALWGDWSVLEVPNVLIRRMTRLMDALSHMWQTDIDRMTHREVYPTICPGESLHRAFGASRPREKLYALHGQEWYVPGCPNGIGMVGERPTPTP